MVLCVNDVSGCVRLEESGGRDALVFLEMVWLTINYFRVQLFHSTRTVRCQDANCGARHP